MSNLTTTPMQQVDLATLPTKDLEKVLAERKAYEMVQRLQKQNEYEKGKENLIEYLGLRAVQNNELLSHFKADAMQRLNNFRQLMLDYGDLRKGLANKGNFEIKNDRFKIKFSSQLKKGFDERGELAEEKLKKFLGTFVKKRDKDLHDLVLSLLERNPKSGDLDISNIQRLYKLEDRFDNSDWRDAIRLFKESYICNGTAYYITVYQRTDTNAWKLVNMNFASL